LVERIKAELPIWGKEILDAGESVWKVNTWFGKNLLTS
jgi:molybdopterin synthase catalytic subunit